MFSVNNFYDYLSNVYGWPVKNSTVWAFKEHGSRDVSLIQNWHHSNDPIMLTGYYYSKHLAFDQEPLNFEQLYYNYKDNARLTFSTHWHKYYSIPELLRHIGSSVYSSFICHSELNSPEVNYFKEYGFLDVHYWYHGLIARDWYRHWKHYVPHNTSMHRFGCYVRDITGTRQYRKHLLDFFKNRVNVYCPLLENKRYGSDASATLEWTDTGKFDIHLVAETLFDTQKTHLTEKVLKPVAMEQPFILLSGPNSLEYMRNYGFQTFDSCWDESYDTILNTNERYEAVINLVESLNNLPAKQYNRIMSRAKLIAQNNREHFYSQRFEDALLNELQDNFTKAFAQQDELFFTKPGGLYFKSMQKFMSIDDPAIHDIRPRNKMLLTQINKSYPTVAKQILKQYPKLF